jgi:hypothetical protein
VIFNWQPGLPLLPATRLPSAQLLPLKLTPYSFFPGNNIDLGAGIAGKPLFLMNKNAAVLVRVTRI